MSTEYTIYLGYLSGYSYKEGYTTAWDELVKSVEALRHNPERIVFEARRLNAPETCERGCCTLTSIATAYQKSAEEAGPLVLYPEEYSIIQLTTGDRMLKEHVRRAFCRLIIEEMHRLGIEVCLKIS